MIKMELCGRNIKCFVRVSGFVFLLIMVLIGIVPCNQSFGMDFGREKLLSQHAFDNQERLSQKNSSLVKHVPTSFPNKHNLNTVFQSHQKRISLHGQGTPIGVKKFSDILDGSYLDVFIVGTLAYVATGLGGLRIIDISDPWKPWFVGEFDNDFTASEVVVSGNYAYIANYDNGLVIVDVSNPSRPVQVGHYDTVGLAYGVFVSGNYTYIADWDNGLVVLNVTDPSRPVHIGDYDTQGFVYSVFVNGSYAYLADYDNGLIVVNVSDPSNPVKVGGYDTEGYAYNVYVKDKYAYIADYDNGLIVVDVGEPSNPVRVGHYDTIGSTSDVFVSTSYAYIADYDNGLVVVDVTDPSNPLEVGHYDTVGSALGVFVTGGYAYIADYDNGLVVMDVSKPSKPVKMGHYDMADYVYSVFVSGTFAYIADYDNGLVVLNVSNPSNPVQVGHYDTAGFVYDVFVSEEYAYVADSGNGLVVVDVTDPSNPLEVGHYDTTGSTVGVVVKGNYAYIADWDNGLVVVDVSNPSNPVKAGGYDTIGRASDVVVNGNNAYIADRENGLVIVDVSNASSLVQVGHFDTVGSAVRVVVNGNNAYIADYGNGLVIVDVSDPSMPVQVSHYDSAGFAKNVFVSGSYAYVADYDNGMLILGVGEAVPPIITNILITPFLVIQGNLVQIKAIVTDSSGVSLVNVVYRISNGTWVSARMTLQDSGIGLYSALLGPFNAGDLVEFYIEAFDACVLTNQGIDNNNGAYYSFIVHDTDNLAPTIHGVVREPAKPRDNETVSISAYITDASGILNASLYYRVNGGSWFVMGMELRQSTNNIYEASIGPFVAGSIVEYYVQAIDNSTQHNIAYALDDSGYYLFVVQSSLVVTDSFGPLISNVTVSPSIVFDNQTVLVSARVNDSSGVSSVLLYYRVNGGSWFVVEMELRQSTNNMYEASIGPFVAGSIVEYYVQATDNSTQKNTTINNNNGTMYSFVVHASKTNQPTIGTSTDHSILQSTQTPKLLGSIISSGSLTLAIITSIITFLGGLFVGIKRK